MVANHAMVADHTMVADNRLYNKCRDVNMLYFCVIQMTAHELWRHIGSDSPNQQQRMAELFHTLHQIAPSVWVCEDIIGRELVSEEEVGAWNVFGLLSHDKY